MSGERSYAILPCPDIDEAIAFYEALGFVVSYRQRRPNPHAVVGRDDLQIHLAGIDGFDPETSYASVIITAPEVETMYQAFHSGLQEHYGKVPKKGIPRILPIRQKAGTATGFSVVDVGGNWLRFYRAGSVEDDPQEVRTGLGRVIDVAARQSDSRGEERQAIAVLDAGLVRNPDAPAAERFEAVAFRAELRLRLDEDATVDLELAAAIAEEYALGDGAQQILDGLREQS